MSVALRKVQVTAPTRTSVLAARPKVGQEWSRQTSPGFVAKWPGDRSKSAKIDDQTMQQTVKSRPIRGEINHTFISVTGQLPIGCVHIRINYSLDHDSVTFYVHSFDGHSITAVKHVSSSAITFTPINFSFRRASHCLMATLLPSVEKKRNSSRNASARVACPPRVAPASGHASNV